MSYYSQPRRDGNLAPSGGLPYGPSPIATPSPDAHLNHYSQSQYSQPTGSYYSQTSINAQRAPSPSHNPPPPRDFRPWPTPTPQGYSYNSQPAPPTAYHDSASSQAHGYDTTSNAPSYHSTPTDGMRPGEVFQHTPATAPMLHHGQPSYASFQNDYPDETKSYSSTTHFAQSKEWGAADAVPPMPVMPPNNYPFQSPAGNLYPPRTPMTPGTPSGSQHWHAVRNQLLERRVVKQIPLHNGNLVMDVPVPRGVVPPSTHGLGVMEGEMTSLRYSAATCDPDEFMARKFNLRQYLWGRKTELFVVMTMYNENADLLLKTLNAVIKNVAHLCGRNRSKTWGQDAWQKVVVCIVADGRKVVDPRVLKVLQLMGVYAEGVAKDTVAGKETQAHIFEYTSQVVVSESGEVGFGSVPVQIVFCLKEQNKKKLNSHRWFFNAFGPLIKPNVCILLDVGTKPSGTSLYELYKVFEKHQNVGGACGEIYADTGKMGHFLLNPLVAGQNFEYKMSNILDKPFESVFGLISVLPGAFSAYRYAAVANHADGTGPLASYFHGEMMNQPGATASIFDRNKFLAEDRILAFEIVVKRNAKWRLQYVKSAKASTDVPNRVPEFISQRRRWLNGIYACWCFYRIWQSNHNIFRKLALHVLFLYNVIQLIFNWLSVSSFYLAFYFLIDSSISGSSDPFGGAGDEIFQIFNKIYIGIIFVVLICSLGNRPQGSNAMYTLCILVFAACQGILLYCAGWTVYNAVPHTVAGWEDFGSLFSNKTFLDLAMSLIRVQADKKATYGLYLISSILYLEPWHMFTSFVQYLFLLPSYVNILLIYAFCNLQDVSWGTKGDNGTAKDLGSAKKVDKDGKEMAEVAVPTRQEDVEALWQQARSEMRVPVKEQHQKRSAETKRSDQDKTFRTNVLLLFLGCNLLVILLFTSSTFTNWIDSHFSEATGTSFNPYLTAIFWAVLVLSALRASGSLLYLVFRLFGY